MRLALLGPAPPFRGGIVAYLAVLARALERRGHGVCWVSFKKQYPRFLFPGRDQKGEAASWLQHENTPIFVPWSPWSWWRTFRLLRRLAPAAVVMKYWIPFFAPGYAVVAWLLRRSTPIRVLYILDNVVPHEKYPFGHLLTRWALRRADGFVAQSDQVRRDLDRIVPGIDPGRVLTAPHPVYDFTAPGQTQKTQGAARTALGLSPDARLVLYFGFIKPYKGVMHLIDAVPRLRERYGREIQVLIVGDIYGDRRPYHDRIDALGVEQNLKLVDSFVPDDEIQDYFLAADLVVLPYVSATQSGIVQIAYNYEKPVVTTNVGGLPEVVLCEKTGFLVPPGDPGALAAAVIRFFDEGWAGRMAAEIAREKDKYSWDRTVVAIENLAAGGR